MKRLAVLLLAACGAAPSPSQMATPNGSGDSAEAQEAEAPTPPSAFEGGVPVEGLPALEELKGGAAGLCGRNRDGIWCWRFPPGADAFRPPEQQARGTYVAIAVGRSLYSLSASGALLQHNHNGTPPFQLAQLAPIPDGADIRMEAARRAVNGAREVVCVAHPAHPDRRVHCVQFSALMPQDHAIRSIPLPVNTARWSLGGNLAIARDHGPIEVLARWPDEWRPRTTWPLVTMEGRSDPNHVPTPLDQDPLQGGTATLVLGTGPIRVQTDEHLFQCGPIGTDRFHPDDFACTQQLPLPQDTLFVRDGRYEVTSATDGAVDLLQRDGTVIFRGARQVANARGDFYALAPDGTVWYAPH